MTTILEINDLEKTFGAVVAAKGINFAVSEHEVIGIIGANGAGKTTFVNMVTGYLKPSRGRIRFMDRDILGLPPRDITKLGICRSFQVSQVFMSETVADNLTVAYGIAEERGLGLLRPLYTADRAVRVEAQVERFRMGDYRSVIAGNLPQGVRKLLDIAMATVRRPALLLLDEPTSGISVEEKFDLMDIIMEALEADRTTVLFVEHDMEIVARYVTRVLAFSQGEIICDAPTKQALLDPRVLELVIGQEYQPAQRGGPAAADA